MKKLSVALVVCVFIMGMGWLPPAPPPPVPILMIHGLYGNPAFWNRLQDWLEEEGFDRELMYAPHMVDNASMCSQRHIDQIEDQIDMIRSETGAEKVTLIGHSRGGTDIMAFMRFSPDNDLVANVITLAGANHYFCTNVYGWPPGDDTPGDALYTSIYTTPTDGNVPAWMARLDGARNIAYTGVSHNDYILTDVAFEDVLDALNGGGLN